MKISISVIIVNLIFLITACTSGNTPVPPAPEQPEAEAQAVEPTKAPTPTPVPEPAPPIVLRTSPERGEEQPLEAPIEITFDQPMERDSVEKAFAIEPGASVDGAFEWVDDETVRFTLNNGFERGQRYKVRLIESAQSQAGLEIQRPFELRFSAVGSLEVTNVTPADESSEILPDTIVTVLFNRPVVPLNAIEDAGNLPHPLTFVPPVRGEGEWLNTSIYQFTPAGNGFEPATEYTARIAKGLTDASGNAVLEDDFEWTFSTVMPAVVATNPAGGDIYVSPTPLIQLAFNQPMDRKDVEENFRLVNNATNEGISGEFTWETGGLEQPTGSSDDDGYYDYTYAEGEGPIEVGVETVAFKPDITLDFDAVYTIELPQGTKGSDGRSQTQRDFSAGFTVTPYPQIASTFPADGDEQIEPWQSLQITFNAPVNPGSIVIGKNLVIEPRVAVTQVYTYWWSSDTNLEINFPTKASRNYQVTLGADVEGRYGQQLGAPTEIAWETRAQNPMIFMHSPGRVAYYNAYTDTLAYVSARNLGRINFRLYRMPAEDFILLNGNNWWEAWDSYSRIGEQPLASWSRRVSPELNSTLIYRVDLGQESGLGDSLPPGLYYLEASVSSDDIYDEAKGPSGQYDLLPERKMLVVSKHNLTLKSSNNEALAWLTDLQSGQPVSGVPISFEAGAESHQDRTDSGGVAQAEYNKTQDAFEAQFAFAGDPDDPDDNFAVAVSNWESGIERWQYNNISTEDYQQAYNGHFYTDRNIYRPGQLVYFKGIIRTDDDANYSLPEAFDEVSVVIRDGQGKEILNDTLPISDFGTVNGSFQLDENAGLGFYNIEIQLDPNTYFYDDFQVAAYRKPEFLVAVETDKPEYAQGDKIKVSASAEFFFGGPVSNANARWTLVSNDFFFNYIPPLKGGIRGGYDFTDYDASRSGLYYSSFGETLAEGEGATDSEGRFTFEVEAGIADKINSQLFTFDVVVTDLNNQEVASQANATVHKGLFYVGLRPERYVGVAGQETSVNVLVVDWDSQPVARQEVQIVFAEHNWFSVQKQYEDGSFYWDSVAETVPVFTTTVTTDRDGQAIASFTPEKGGVFRALSSAEDSKGNTVSSSTFMWISGQEYVNWRQENNDRIELVTDKREYNVGDTATILVPHPYNGPVQALVTLERGHIYDHFVTELETNSEQLEIPITEDMIPNMFVSVTVVQGAIPPSRGGEQGGGGCPVSKSVMPACPSTPPKKSCKLR